ncbi:benenodin family lasso peptide [Sphingobium yanoikuyae]|nr:benenodin family lasso peptide [Sphingobium yanoikuyae]
METHDEDLIDLGEIAAETKGPALGQGDVIGLQLPTGLTDD